MLHQRWSRNQGNGKQKSNRKINEKKGWFPEKFNKTDKPPAALSRKKKEKVYQYWE